MADNKFVSNTKTSVVTKVSTQTKVLLGLMIVASIAGMFAIVGGLIIKNNISKTQNIQNTTLNKIILPKIRDVAPGMPGVGDSVCYCPGEGYFCNSNGVGGVPLDTCRHPSACIHSQCIRGIVIGIQEGDNWNTWYIK